MRILRAERVRMGESVKRRVGECRRFIIKRENTFENNKVSMIYRKEKAI